jgi:hypothetical protein
MKNVSWLTVGVGVGFVAAHIISRTPQGKQFFDNVDAKTKEFSAALVDGYKEREAELRAVVAEAGDVLSDIGERGK